MQDLIRKRPGVVSTRAGYTAATSRTRPTAITARARRRSRSSSTVSRPPTVTCSSSSPEPRPHDAESSGLMPDDYLDGLAVDDRTAQWTRILPASWIHHGRSSSPPTTAASSGSSRSAARWTSQTPRADRSTRSTSTRIGGDAAWGARWWPPGAAICAASDSRPRCCGCTGTMRGRVASTARRAGVPMPPSVAPTRSAPYT